MVDIDNNLKESLLEGQLKEKRLQFDIEPIQEEKDNLNETQDKNVSFKRMSGKDENTGESSNTDKENAINKNSIVDPKNILSIKYQQTKANKKQHYEVAKSIIKREQEGKYSVFETSKLLLHENTLLVFSSAATYLIHIINLIMLNQYTADSLLYTSTYQIGCIYLTVFGFNFLKGTLDSFKSIASFAVIKNDYDRFIRFYQESRIFALLVFLIIVFPLSFTSRYFLMIFNFEENLNDLIGTFVKANMIANIFLLFADINCIFLSFIEHKSYILATNLTCLAIHIIFSILFVFYFDYGAMGIAFSMCVSGLVKFIVTQFFCFYFNPAPEKNIVFIDVSVLNSSYIFFYIKNATIFGLVSAIKFLPFDLVTFMGFFFGFKSFLANIIIWNIISFYFLLIESITCNFEHILSPYIMKTIKTISESELSEFISKYPELKKFFDKKQVSYSNTIKYLFSKAKFNNHILKIESMFQDQNLKRIKSLIRAIIVFAFVFCVLNSIVLFALRYHFTTLFTHDEWIMERVVPLIDLYCIVVIFDWGGIIYTALISCFYSLFNYTIVRGLFGVGIFLPLGIVLSTAFKVGIYGYWYSFFSYFIMFSIVAFFYFHNMDIKANCEKIRENFFLTQKNKEELENIYKVTQK